MTPEFRRLERVDTIGAGKREVAIEADADERRRLAARFGLLSIERLAARFTLHREDGAIIAEGRVEADVTQACTATDDPLPARVDESVELRFVAEDAGKAEIELSAGVLDTLPIEDGAIDLGEAAAETMALALDPFPRGPNAAAALAEAGVIDEDQSGAFGALASLKARLKPS